MDFDVTDLLENLFGGVVSVPMVAIDDLAELPDAPVDPSSADPFADWVYRPDSEGRMGWQAPDLAEVVPSEAMPWPNPCPRCGSLEKWWDVLGGEHCSVCEQDKLKRAIRWAETAARLRAANPPKPKSATA
ncbi:MAG: hypothetical protein ABFC54_07725 [Thermoguttaceae bacterium]